MSLTILISCIISFLLFGYSLPPALLSFQTISPIVTSLFFAFGFSILSDNLPNNDESDMRKANDSLLIMTFQKSECCPRPL